jgi:hypothetical protein
MVSLVAYVLVVIGNIDIVEKAQVLEPVDLQLIAVPVSFFHLLSPQPEQSLDFSAAGLAIEWLAFRIVLTPQIMLRRAKARASTSREALGPSIRESLCPGSAI